MTEPEVIRALSALVGAAIVPIVAIESDTARFRWMKMLHPRSGFPSFLIMLALLFGLATATRTWELPHAVSGAIMPLAGIGWLLYFRRRHPEAWR